MLKMLLKNPKEIPTPDRQDMIDMAMKCIRTVNDSFDASSAFKSLFMTNALDGSEDRLVSDKIRGLVYEDIAKFREDLMKTPPPPNIPELFKTLTPPKGVKRKNNIEGGELYDHDDEGPEMDPDDLAKEFEYEVKDDVNFVQSKPSEAFVPLDEETPQEKPSRIRQQFWPLAG